MIPAAIREEQATACLEAAEKYRDLLLALAYRLAGNQEDGMDLFQQTCLNCHDAIQRNGFAGDKYQFYLRTAMHNLFKRNKQRGNREIPYDFQEVATYGNTRDDEGDAPWAANAGDWRRAVGKAASVGEARELQNSEAYLAEQVMHEARASFTDADRVLLRLHLDGCTTRQIAEALGKGDHTAIWRRLDKMKDYLRDTFQQAWDALSE